MNSGEKGLEPPFRRELLERIGEENVIPLLPATYRTHYMVRLVSSDIRAFLESEFDLARLNRVHKWLWLAGLPSSPRPLHYQRVKQREIVIAEQLDLHLIWSPARIFIKPLPRFLLSSRFWQLNICPYPYIYQTALGFLLSYVALIEREVDFAIASNSGLIPGDITWPGWLTLVEEIVAMSSQSHSYLSSSSASSGLSSLEPHVPVNPRFYYGELRVGRLNWIYRLVLGQPRGYLSGCTTYGAFLRDNVNSLITLFAYTTIVLSAMQVGLATQFLVDDYAFSMASYVFSVFAILAPLSAIAAILFVLVLLFAINLVRTLRIQRKRRRQGAGV
ncbi:hypothetical protein BDV96DRAFT_104708 [Lophiotrema nucula]|uniref:Uncharacterized protein n=1 Tax=Lophiotrema nucula TaxID=690887 RepID=A0A6A5Z3D4_9PLEO|nr:hypothetical protein BDV96DRAFT_104708 [Lophiotrema nucula]